MQEIKSREHYRSCILHPVFVETGVMTDLTKKEKRKKETSEYKVKMPVCTIGHKNIVILFKKFWTLD